MTLSGHRPGRALATAGLALSAGLGLLAGCTSGKPAAHNPGTPVAAGALRLVAFDSCSQALNDLRGAAKDAVGPYGFGEAFPVDLALGGPGSAGERGVPPDAANSVPAPKAAQDDTGYSGTNTHEVGVDEPDLIKTDGHRIVTISRGTLRVIDAGTRRQTGSLSLAKDTNDLARFITTDLLLAGDHALVLLREGYGRMIETVPDAPQTDLVNGPRLLLIDLHGGTPRLLSTYRIDGSLVDARQVGSSVRVVIRSVPRIAFPIPPNQTDEQRMAQNRDLIDRAGIDAWLPRYEIDTGDQHSSGAVDCASVSRPTVYSGSSLLTVLTVDLNRDALGSGDPVTIAADGQTVYGTGTSLYVATDQRWRAVPLIRTKIAAQPRAVPARTDIYRFDTSGAGRPRFTGGGSVPGWLINQYAMSEYAGNLRVATTTTEPWSGASQGPSQSSVYVLRQQGSSLAGVGHVDGLGTGERIYAVRFVGPLGYVVTFRQTDPLYTVDLRDPAHPKVLGELKINGYSAYLHPVGDKRLIGVGQEADPKGRVQGTQLSLFDVSDPAQTKRLAQYHVQFGHSEAEFDPHAFLYWPATGLLVIPLQTQKAEFGALALRVDDSGFTELGMVTHPARAGLQYSSMVRRSLVIDRTLWTVSDAGLAANGLDGLDRQAWIPFG